MPTVISTFAGCGGSSLGYQLAGYRELLAVEWDNNAVETFKLNFPDVPVYHGDIGKLTGEECLRLAGISKGELDVLDGSPPCQGFSTAGKRKFDDPRNSLFMEYARLLDELQPKVFVMENVTGMVKGVMKQAYLEIVKTLRGCGYQVKGQVLNAMYYNVPQSRERVIIIGVRNDLNIEPSHPKPRGKPITVREALVGINGESAIIIKPEWHTYKMWLKTKKGHSFAQSTKTTSGYSFIKIHPDRPSPTIPKSLQLGNKRWGAHVHWDQPRSLSIEEIKRLSSFPDDFITIGKISDQWARIGNSVPPNLMKAIAEHIKTEILSR